MRNRARVRRVQIEVSRENREALRIGRFDRQNTAAAQTRAHSRIISGKARGVQMLHHLGTEDAVELPFRLRGEIRKKSASSALQALLPALRDRFCPEIDAAARTPSSRISSRNSPRPQPISSTFSQPAKYGL